MEKPSFHRAPVEKPKVPALVKAYEKAVEELETDVMNMDSLVDLYGAENVAADKAEVARLEKIFADNSNEQIERAKRTATILEAIIHDQFEMSDWFGPNARTIKPSRYDDIKNGIDTIVEIEKENEPKSHMALAIDVTFSTDMEEKFARIKKEIDQERLAKIKYFNSDTHRGEVSQKPRVIIGADIDTIDELAALWTDGSKESRDRLAKHPIQIVLLDQILNQLEYFKVYAQRNKKEAVIPALSQAIYLVKEVYDDRLKKIPDTGAYNKMTRNLDERMRNIIY